MIAYPIEIYKSKYPRGAIKFSIGILLDSKDHETNEKMYSALLRKVGKVLIDLEEECEFVWSEKYKQETSNLIKPIYEDMQENNWMYCKITEFTSLYAKLIPLDTPCIISFRDYEVPIFIKELVPSTISDLGVLYL